MPRSSHLLHRTRSAAGLLAAVLVALAAVGFTAPDARSADATVTRVGTFQPTVFPPGESLGSVMATSLFVPEPTTRTLFVVSPSWLVAYDLDTLRPKGGGLALSGGVITTTFADPISGTLIVGLVNRALSQMKLEQFSARSGTAQSLGSVQLATFLGPQVEVKGIARHPTRPILWLLASAPALAQRVGVVVAELGFTDNLLSRTTQHWAQVLPQTCQALMQANESIPAGFGYGTRTRALYFGCAHSGNAAATVRVPRGAARLSLSEAQPDRMSAGTFELFPTPGDYNVADAVFEPRSERLALSTVRSTTGATMTLFDGETGSYLGGFAIGALRPGSLGVDVSAGRVYAVTSQTGVGLVATDVQATPVRQGLTFPAFAQEGNRGLSDHPLGVDPPTSRLFIKYTDIVVVAHDAVPKYEPPLGDDADRNTTDVAEDPARTSAVFSAAAQGFGSRHRQVGGTDALIINYLGTNIPPQLHVAGKGTRELRTSYLNGLALANSEAGASAIAADRDRDNTGSDMTRAQDIARQARIDSDAATGWGYETAHCVDFGNEPSDVTEDFSEASCDAARNRVAARTRFDDAEAGGVGVDRSSLSATAVRHTTRGVVSRVESEAHGIEVLGGILRFGKVTAQGEAWAKGRPGTAGSTYERQVEDVTLQGQKLCASNCDLQKLSSQINSTLAGRVRVEFPMPDAKLAAGSPGGYQALLRRPATAHAQEQALNGQPPDRVEVPGMVVTVFHDDAKPGRTIVELAAVEVEARYGITLLSGSDPDAAGGGDGGGIDGVGSIGGIGGAVDGGGPLFGLDPDDGGLVGSAAGGRGGRIPAELALSPGGLIWNGLGRIADLLPVWAVLLLPVYLSARRWLLLQRETFIAGGAQ